jgi:hypothetical protein
MTRWLFLLVAAGVLFGSTTMVFAKDLSGIAPPSIDWLRYIKQIKSGERRGVSLRMDTGKGQSLAYAVEHYGGKTLRFLREGPWVSPTSYDLRAINPTKVPAVRDRVATTHRLELRDLFKPRNGAPSLAAGRLFGMAHGSYPWIDWGPNDGGNFRHVFALFAPKERSRPEADCPYDSGPVTGTYNPEEQFSTYFAWETEESVSRRSKTLSTTTRPPSPLYTITAPITESGTLPTIPIGWVLITAVHKRRTRRRYVGWDDTFPKENFNAVIVDNRDR